MKNTPLFLKIIYLIWGFVALVGFTGYNVLALTYNTLVLGERPIFDERAKTAAGGVIVNHYDGTRRIL